METIKVGIADYRVSRDPVNIVTVGLGSCVGIALYDPVSKVGALIHIMLPRSTDSNSRENKAKFADTAIPLVLEEMERLGARRENIVAKLAGGAKMFSIMTTEQIKHIGERNVIAAAETLKAEGVRIASMETGGSVGRTMELDTSSGRVRVRSVGAGVKEI
ncbi:MAG: chemotaxis protein CheD [Euryarchaeota archaeon]|nr:chemotaxis protein CheD [Euryarchaeota archaeon]